MGFIGNFSKYISTSRFQIIFFVFFFQNGRINAEMKLMLPGWIHWPGFGFFGRLKLFLPIKDLLMP